MLKQVYKIDSSGYLQDILIKEFDEDGNCIEELPPDIITIDPPQGLYGYKWTGAEWIETTTEEEYIATLPEQPHEPTETEKLQEKVNMLQSALDFIIINY